MSEENVEVIVSGDIVVSAGYVASLLQQRADLLEALKDTVRALECCGKDYPAMTKGRAAITKAEENNA